MNLFSYLRLRVFPPGKLPPPQNMVDVYIDQDTGELIRESSEGVKTSLGGGITEGELNAALATKVSKTGDTISGNLAVNGYVSAQGGVSVTGGVSIANGSLEVFNGGVTLTGDFPWFSGQYITTDASASGGYQDNASRYVSVLSSRVLTTENSPFTNDNGKIITVFGTNAVSLTIPDDNNSNQCVIEIINHTNGAGSLTLIAATSVIVNGTTAGSLALPRFSRATLKRIAFDTWSLQVEEAPIKGPYADDSAAETAGVVIGERYYKAAGTVHVRLT